MDRRAHYLSTALDLFSTHGFHGVSMDSLVATAGGSKATLYRYFSSKEELFEATIAGLAAETAIDRPAAELADLTLEEGLRALAHATARAALSDTATVLFRLAVGEVTRFPALAKALFERGPAQSYARLRTFLADRVAAGELEVPDLQIAAEQFLGGVIGHQQLRRALGLPALDADELSERVEAAIRSLLAAHGPASPRASNGRQPRRRRPSPDRDRP